MPRPKIREKFLEYYPEEDLKKWFDPLIFSYRNLGSGGSPGFGTFSTAWEEACPLCTVKFPHKLFAEWFNQKYRDKFEKVLTLFFGQKPKIEYGFLKDKEITTPEYSESIRFDTVEHKNEQTFQSFIYNRKNQFPVAAAREFSQKGYLAPFVLFGPPGSGKTHLLKAIYHELCANVPEKNILAAHLNDLETFLSKSFTNSDSPLLSLRQFKYILVDDFDMAESRPLLQEMLVRLLEESKNAGINLAFTIKQKPAHLALLGARLRSLLEASLAIELKKPDLDVRRQYVEYLSNRLDLQIKKDDALTLARMYSDFRQIDGAIYKISSFMVLSPQAAEAKLADILQTSISEIDQRITPDQIIGAVAEYFKVSPADLTGKKRRRDIVKARHTAMYLCRELLNAQLGHIGTCFSDRDHSSVLYSINKIKQMIKSDKDMHNLLTEVKNILFR